MKCTAGNGPDMPAVIDQGIPHAETDVPWIRESAHREWPGAAYFVTLAAAPTFAIMALLTALFGPPDMICSVSENSSPLSGMVPMYALMSAFHSAPWLKLISSGRNNRRRA